MSYDSISILAVFIPSMQVSGNELLRIYGVISDACSHFSKFIIGDLYI
jgi:hypothetical protein